MRTLSLLLFLLIHLPLFAQEPVLIDDPGKHPVLLNTGWVYCMASHSDDRVPSAEDTCWKPIRPASDIHKFLPEDAKTGIGYMRLRF